MDSQRERSDDDDDDEDKDPNNILKSIKYLDEEYEDLEEKERVLLQALRKLERDEACLKRALEEADPPAASAVTAAGASARNRSRLGGGGVLAQPAPNGRQPTQGTASLHNGHVSENKEEAEAARRLEQALFDDSSGSDSDDDGESEGSSESSE